MRVELRALRRADGGLEVTVADDGAGFAASAGGSGLGLSNIRERLRQMYGDTAALTLEGAPGRRCGCDAEPAAGTCFEAMNMSSMSSAPTAKAPTALIADDEDLPRAELRRMLATAWPELQVVAECEDGPAAVEALDAHAPQIAFLDIRMPGMNGLDVARAASGRCHTVFTTAYDSHAVAAFDAGAVDYLLKPINAERLAQAVLRLRERLRGQAVVPDLDALLQRLGQRLHSGMAGARGAGDGPARLRWLSASVGETIKMFAIDEVLFFQSDEKYTRVVTATDEAHVRKPLREISDGLDPDDFWQVHRGTVVRASAIARAQRDELGPHHAAPATAPRNPGGEPGLGLALQAHVAAAARRWSAPMRAGRGRAGLRLRAASARRRRPAILLGPCARLARCPSRLANPCPAPTRPQPAFDAALLFDAAPAALLHVGADGELLRVNAAARELCGAAVDARARRWPGRASDPAEVAHAAAGHPRRAGWLAAARRQRASCGCSQPAAARRRLGDGTAPRRRTD